MTALSRREFVAGACAGVGLIAFGGVTKAFGANDELLRPPGGQEEAWFVASCIKCDRCRSVCPQSCITTATVSDGFLEARTPKLDYHKGFCDFCNLCIDACPTGALKSFDPYSNKIGVAVLDTTTCIAYTLGACVRCYDACRFEALALDAAGRPVIVPERCNGCGECVDACTVNVYRSFDGSALRAIEVKREGASI